MNLRLPLAAAIAAVLIATTGQASAAASDYAFEPVNAEMKKGDDVTVAVRLIQKSTGKSVADAVIIRTRVDMTPDGMAEMQSPVSALPAKEPGIYAFKTNFPMAGRYQLSLAAKVQGEPETVIGNVIVRASK